MTCLIQPPCDQTRRRQHAAMHKGRNYKHENLAVTESGNQFTGIWAACGQRHFLSTRFDPSTFPVRIHRTAGLTASIRITNRKIENLCCYRMWRTPGPMVSTQQDCDRFWIRPGAAFLQEAHWQGRIKRLPKKNMRSYPKWSLARFHAFNRGHSAKSNWICFQRDCGL